jgi:hypothetical protein
VDSGESTGTVVNLDRILGLELQPSGEYEVILKSNVRLRLSEHGRRGAAGDVFTVTKSAQGRLPDSRRDPTIVRESVLRVPIPFACARRDRNRLYIINQSLMH